MRLRQVWPTRERKGAVGTQCIPLATINRDGSLDIDRAVVLEQLVQHLPGTEPLWVPIEFEADFNKRQG